MISQTRSLSGLTTVLSKTILMGMIGRMPVRIASRQISLIWGGSPSETWKKEPERVLLLDFLSHISLLFLALRVAVTSSGDMYWRGTRLQWYVNTWAWQLFYVRVLIIGFQLFVASFSPADFYGFQAQVDSLISSFLAAGATNLIIDLTDNGGGYVCRMNSIFACYLVKQANEMCSRSISFQVSCWKQPCGKSVCFSWYTFLEF
jgi:hypothetical protein